VAPYLTIKAGILITAVLLLPLYMASSVLLEDMPSWLLPVYKIIDWSMLVVNCAYFGMFYHDLKFVSLEFNYSKDTKEFRLLNSSTL
jgi:hypothetical protein